MYSYFMLAEKLILIIKDENHNSTDLNNEEYI